MLNLITIALGAALTVALIELVLGSRPAAHDCELHLDTGRAAATGSLPGHVFGPLPLLLAGLGIPALAASLPAGLALLGLAAALGFGPRLLARSGR